MNLFHLALPVYDLEASRKFYGDLLGLKQRRSAFNWIDFDFFGHQLSLHLVRKRDTLPESTLIDGDQVPARHFGVILSEQNWKDLRDNLSSEGQKFIIGPKIRFKGKEGEQGSLFITDPSGNYLEFKYFTNETEQGW